MIGLVQIKLIIIGNSGSGKTWLATRLATTTKTSVVHLDEIFWEPGGFNQKRSSEELDRLITETKQGTSWIVEGVFGELTERYFDEAELFIWLDIDWEICKARLLTRGSESKRHLGRVQSEKGLGELIEWLRNTTIVTIQGRLQATTIFSTGFQEKRCASSRNMAQASS